MKPYAFWTASIVTVSLAIAAYGQSNPSATNQDAAVRAVIKTFADARNAADGNAAAATYAEDGEYIALSGVRTRGRAALIALWCCVSQGSRPVQRIVHSVEFVTPNVAVVRAIAEFDEIKARLSETYVLIKDDNDQWKIRVHQAGGVTLIPTR